MHCLGSFLRAFILLGGFMVGHHVLGIWQARSSKQAPRKVGASTGRQRIAIKRTPKTLSDDEDAASTSAGSSDGASDILSSDEEEIQGARPGRISKADLLSLRPARCSTHVGGLQAMGADQQRSASQMRVSKQNSPSLPVGGAPKLARKAAPAPKSLKW